MKNTNKNHLLSIFISLYLSVLVHQISAADNASYVAADKIFLNCGSSLETQDTDGRSWEGDNDSKFAASEENTLTSRAATQDPSVAEVPYMTARIFRSEFTYSFPVGSGRKFVRLYFYPSSYAGLNASNAIFSVTSGRYTLLRNFSVSQTTEALNYAFIVKEFSINVENGRVNVTFTPSPYFTNSYAFVNGIEVVSMPDIYNTADGTTTIVGQGSAIFIIDNTTALEKVVRLNVGGSEISPAEDTGLFRSWSDDSSYIFAAQFGVTDTASPNMSIRYPRRIPPYVAPVNV
ncbi:Malectin-like carbohydrate-binding domain [Macleaya cordata]|uniref:Malectin-like carbohydrate-binding domain n=1 Tax=Macleaya cordata TaxID=56857 RepID=A0A200QTA2_MACCD|nr:Malectin-like carbohydrate-binding domain [Macleaya cordata]